MTVKPMRRRLLRAGLGGMATALAAPGLAAAPSTEMKLAPRLVPGLAASDVARLAFVNTHTGESLDLVYREGRHYLSDAMAEIDRLLRDHRSDEVHPIDRGVLDQLDHLSAVLDVGKRPIHVISGYRSPSTNAKLAARSGGVAKRSLHMSGRAIDIRLPGVPLATLHQAALQMQAGGVGYYRRSQFVHLDVGRVRNWRD